MKKIYLAIVMIIFPVMANAVQFDIWKTGETKNEIIKKTKKYNVKTSNSKGNKYRGHYNIPANEISYSDRLLGERAEINLAFTKKSNLLYGIFIEWRNIEIEETGEEIYSELKKVLNKKYSKINEWKGVSYISQRGKEYRDCKTTNNSYKNNEIKLQRTKCKNKIFISSSYIDNELEKKNKIEMRQAEAALNDDKAKF